MTQIDVLCGVVEWEPFHRLISLVGTLGDGWAGAALAAALSLLGFATRRPGLARAGLLALLAVLAAGTLSNLFKLGLAMERPDPGSKTYGFPSGHSGTAFALAGALGYAWPASAPWLGLMAVGVGIARVYVRAHFVVDVLGGGLLGTLLGVLVARAGLPAGRAGSRPGWPAWGVTAALALALLAGAAVYEREIRAHRAPRDTGTRPPAVLSLEFGTPRARSTLVSGWGADERWHDRFPMVWAIGREARISLPALPSADQRLRLRMAPFVRQHRPSCQRVDIAMNGLPLGRLLLERGWQEYEARIPAAALRAGGNEMVLRFSSAMSPAAAGISRDTRPLSAAIARLDVVAYHPDRLAP